MVSPFKRRQAVIFQLNSASSVEIKNLVLFGTFIWHAWGELQMSFGFVTLKLTQLCYGVALLRFHDNVWSGRLRDAAVSRFTQDMGEWWTRESEPDPDSATDVSSKYGHSAIVNCGCEARVDWHVSCPFTQHFQTGHTATLSLCHFNTNAKLVQSPVSAKTLNSCTWFFHAIEIDCLSLKCIWPGVLSGFKEVNRRFADRKFLITIASHSLKQKNRVLFKHLAWVTSPDGLPLDLNFNMPQVQHPVDRLQMLIESFARIYVFSWCLNRKGNSAALVNRLRFEWKVNSVGSWKEEGQKATFQIWRISFKLRHIWSLQRWLRKI